MSISNNHNFVVANDTLTTLTKIRNGIEKQTFDGDNLNTKISNFPVGGATEITLNGIKTQLEKQTFDGDNLNTKISNFPVGGATETTLNNIKTATDKLTFDGVNLNTKISNFPIGGATETTLNNIKTATDKLTFDGVNLNTKISNFPIGGATEITLDGIKTATDKLTFDDVNSLNVTIVSDLTQGGGGGGGGGSIDISTLATEETLSSYTNSAVRNFGNPDMIGNKFPACAMVATDTTNLKYRYLRVNLENNLMVIEPHVRNHTQFMIDNDLRFLRSVNKCFRSGTYFNIINNALQHSLLNPVGNTKTLYLHTFSISVFRGPTPDTIAACFLRKIQNFPVTGGGALNSNFSGNNSTARTAGGNIAHTNHGNIFGIGLDSSGTSTHTQIFEEYIRIPQGFGIGLHMEGVLNAHQGSASFAWFEE